MTTPISYTRKLWPATTKIFFGRPPGTTPDESDRACGKQGNPGRLGNRRHPLQPAGSPAGAGKYVVLRRHVEVNDPVIQNVDFSVVVEVAVVPAEHRTR